MSPGIDKLVDHDPSAGGVAGITPASGRSTVGQLIRTYRIMAGLTQEELSEKSDLSVRALRNLELDKVNRPRRRTLQRLAPALELDGAHTAYLLSVAGAGPPVDRPATEIGPGAWPGDCFTLQLLLGQLIEQLGTEQVMVVSMSVHSTRCKCLRFGCGVQPVRYAAPAATLPLRHRSSP
jgi:transcriptional regulator with XRE-family HTH domain